MTLVYLLSSSDMDLIVGRYNVPMKFFSLSLALIQELSCCDVFIFQGWIVQEINDVSVDTLINSFFCLLQPINLFTRREIAQMLRHITPRLL